MSPPTEQIATIADPINSAVHCSKTLSHLVWFSAIGLGNTVERMTGVGGTDLPDGRILDVVRESSL